MLVNKCLLGLALLGPLPLLAAPSVSCPATLQAKGNNLVNVRLFDGPPAELAELVPDNENGATWDVRGYQTSERPLVLMCDYKDGSHQELTVPKTASRCIVSGHKKLAASCR